MSITIDESFLEGKTPDELYVLMYLMTHADEDGNAMFSVRELSRKSGIAYKKVRLIIDNIEREGAQLAAQSRAQFRAQLGAQQLTCINVSFSNTNKETKDKNGAVKGAVKGAHCGAVKGAAETMLSVKDESIDLVKLKDYFNDRVHGTMIPTISAISDKRRESVSARMKVYGKRAIFDVIENAVASDFLSGRSSDFHASFDWLLGVKNFPKVLEGNYANDTRNTNRGLGKSGSAERLSEINRIIDELERD